VSTANDLMSDPAEKDKEKAMSLDLKSLRAFRVIRPLKLVNGVPSKLNFFVLLKKKNRKIKPF
jgi:hypothetical protein